MVAQSRLQEHVGSWLTSSSQLRLLLERHLTRRPWGENLDVAVDRWRLNLEQRRNLEDYLRTNYRLRPMIGYITMVDSVYADPVQVADIYARVARRVLTGDADREKEELCRRLMDLSEVTGGLRSPGGPYGA